MNERSTLRLPAFVNAHSIQKMLGWAPSIRRAFRDAAIRGSIDGWPIPQPDGVYDGILGLVARPAGMRTFEALVGQADPSKKRGLLAAVHRGLFLKAAASGSEKELVEELRESLAAGQLEEVAWIVFHRLAFAVLGSTMIAEPDLQQLIEFIEHDVELRTALGDYWIDWTTMSEPESMPPVAETRGLIDLWSKQVEELTNVFAGAAPFDGNLPERLEAAAEIFRSLIVSHADEAGRAIAAQGIAARERFTTALTALGGVWGAPVTSAPVLINAAAAATNVELLDRATEWAVGSQSAIHDSNMRCRIAAARRQEEDTNEADDEDVAANRERRALRAQIESEAIRWAETLSDHNEDVRPAGMAETARRTAEVDTPLPDAELGPSSADFAHGPSVEESPISASASFAFGPSDDHSEFENAADEPAPDPDGPAGDGDKITAEHVPTSASGDDGLARIIHRER